VRILQPLGYPQQHLPKVLLVLWRRWQIGDASKQLVDLNEIGGDGIAGELPVSPATSAAAAMRCSNSARRIA
jgi:hypothetical protein